MDTESLGVFDAKTHFSRLLRQAERGRSFVIRRRGKAVARLIPFGTTLQTSDIRSAVAAFRLIRRRIGP